MNLASRANLEAQAIDRLLDTEMKVANQAGYDANYEGVLLRDNPYPQGSGRHNAWEAGHLQAASVRAEWEAYTYSRGSQYGEES